jgi:hypothetical protein
MQLDLFAHSRDVMLRNDLVMALRARDLAAGRKAHAKLAAECPQEALLAPAAILLEQLGRRLRPFADPLAASQAVARIDDEIRRAAGQVFGPGKADEWLVPLWQALADAVAALPFRPDLPEAHVAGVLMRARQWHRAREAAEAIPSWRRIPHPLAWMSEIAFELDGMEGAWPLLAELAWLDPVRFAALARRLAAPPLSRLLRDFDRVLAADDDAEFAWFPAWALIAEPALAEVLRGAETPVQSPPELAAHTVMQLLTLERQGRHHELIAKRKGLRALHAGLFEHYMATRA